MRSSTAFARSGSPSSAVPPSAAREVGDAADEVDGEEEYEDGEEKDDDVLASLTP
jgi:hypothetical protein